MDNQLYFIRAYRRGYAYNSPIWWGPERAGYTAYLDKAGRYTFEEACRICQCGADGEYLDPKQADNFERNEMYRVEPLLACAHQIADEQDFEAAGVEGGK